MANDIEWKCLGDEYVLIRGNQRRVVLSELWWASIRGAAPTPQELETLWSQGVAQHEVDTTDRKTADYLAVAEELETYLKDLEAELRTADEEASAGHGSKAEVRRLEGLIAAAREQLSTVRRELRGMMS